MIKAAGTPVPRNLLLLTSVMTLIALAVGGLTIGLLYRAGVDSERQLLVEMVASEARLLSSIARAGEMRTPMDWQGSDALESWIDNAGTAFHGPSATGELLVARRNGDAIRYLTRPRHATPATVAGAPEFVAMRRALAGESGVTTARDYRDNVVLAAYAPVTGTDLGIVAKIDLAEVRRPYLRAGLIALACAAVLITIGCYLVQAVTTQMVRRISDAEGRFRELFTELRSGGFIVEAIDGGKDFVVLDWNLAAERLDHLRRDQVVDRRLSDIMPEARRSGLLQVLTRVWRSGEAEHVPVRYQDNAHGGEWRDGYVYRLRGGNVVVLFDDLTEHKQAEQSLHDSEARWRSIIELQGEAMLLIDKDHQIRFANRAAETLFGLPSEKLVGAPFGHPVASGDIADIEIFRPNRQIAYAEMQVIPMRWGNEEQSLLFLHDVSAHRRTEGDLRKLFQAIEQSPASVVITDIEGRIEYVNPKFTQTSGYTYPEVVGKNPRILKAGKTPHSVYSDLWRTIVAGNVWHGEFLNKKKSGDLYWELASVAPVRDARGNITHYVAVKEDITERKATEERMRQAQKMNALGELTGGIAHDFNNLLAIILGNMQLLDEMIGDEPEKRELIADAIWSAERGAELTNRLLAFARRQRLHPEITNLNSVIREMTDLLRRTLGERIEVREMLAADLWQTMVDPGQLQNALLNLVVNARDAMSGGGVLTIATENAVVEADSGADAQSRLPGEYAVISVTDTGSGMPPEIAERIFEPFFTTKKFGKGSGLGLSMVYGFVSQSGGHVTVDSRVGHGSTIRLYLPKSASPEPLPAPDRAAGGVADPTGKTVLVVEDDERVRKSVVRSLQMLGCEVVAAGSAPEALDRLSRLSEIDLLLIDVILSEGMNGPELAREVYRRRPGIRVLFTSGYAQDPTIGRGLPSGRFDVLPKPFRREVLKEKVREMLSRVIV